MAAGILTVLGAGILISLLLSSKKGRQTGKNLLNKGNRFAEGLKGKFSEFIDQMSDKVQGRLK